MARATTINRPRGGKAMQSSRAVGYVRRSTDRQEQSIPDQQRAIEQYAEEHGLHLLRFYIDDAISGTSTIGRRAFQSMIADARRPGCDFSLVIVYDVKRFGRVDNDEAGYYRHILREAGVEVIYTSENFTGDSTDDLIRPVKQWQARQESKDLAKVAIRGLLSKTESGGGWWMGGAPPFGYDLRYESQSGECLFSLRYMRDGTKQMFDENWRRTRILARGETVAVSRKDRCRLVPSEKTRVETIKRIFSLYVDEGCGFLAIAKLLNRKGVPTSRGPGWARTYSGRWAQTTLRAIIMNPAYAGDLVWNRRTDARFFRIANGQAVERKGLYGRRLEPNDESDWIVIPDAHPAIVPRRMFEAAKKRLEQRAESRRQRGINPRTGQPAGGQASPNGNGVTGPRRKFLLSVLCTCAKCGSRYEGHTSYRGQRDETGKRKKVLEYACGGYIRHGRSVCKLRPVPKVMLEDAVVDAAIEYYDRYRGSKARVRIARALNRQVTSDQRVIEKERAAVGRSTEKIEATIRKLLDNITETNRAHVDRRIEELSAEREALDACTGALDRQLLSEDELRGIVAETASLATNLEATLREGRREERHAPIRRCVHSIVIDHDGGEARIAFRVLPTLPGGSIGSAIEKVVIRLPRRDRR